MVDNKEATFRFQFLTNAKAEVLLSQLPNLLALNLSQNKLEDVPTGLPPTLIALDLSFNLLTSLTDSRRLTNLIELKLSNNAIESTAGLSLAVSLEYLDLSNNRLKVLAGLESLGRLKDLQLENNLISKPVALRSLSLNLELVNLVLTGNPISLLSTYKTIVLSFALNLKKLDGKNVKSNAQNNDCGYNVSLVGQKGISPATMKVQPKTQHCSGNTIPQQPPLSATTRPRSKLLWRNQPTLLPKDRQGRTVCDVAAPRKISSSTPLQSSTPTPLTSTPDLHHWSIPLYGGSKLPPLSSNESNPSRTMGQKDPSNPRPSFSSQKEKKFSTHLNPNQKSVLPQKQSVNTDKYYTNPKPIPDCYTGYSSEYNQNKTKKGYEKFRQLSNNFHSTEIGTSDYDDDTDIEWNSRTDRNSPHYSPRSRDDDYSLQQQLRYGSYEVENIRERHSNPHHSHHSISYKNRVNSDFNDHHNYDRMDNKSRRGVFRSTYRAGEIRENAHRNIDDKMYGERTPTLKPIRPRSMDPSSRSMDLRSTDPRSMNSTHRRSGQKDKMAKQSGGRRMSAGTGTGTRMAPTSHQEFRGKFIGSDRTGMSARSTSLNNTFNGSNGDLRNNHVARNSGSPKRAPDRSSSSHRMSRSEGREGRIGEDRRNDTGSTSNSNSTPHNSNPGRNNTKMTPDLKKYIDSILHSPNTDYNKNLGTVPAPSRVWKKDITSDTSSPFQDLKNNDNTKYNENKSNVRVVGVADNFKIHGNRGSSSSRSLTASTTAEVQELRELIRTMTERKIESIRFMQCAHSFSSGPHLV